MKPIDWLMGRDTGISSKTIWAVMNDANVQDHDTPRDAGDFGRCHRLLALFPEWRARLPEVSARYKNWGPMVAAWDELTAAYEQRETRGDWDRNEAATRAFYRRIQELVNAGRLADGWTQPSPGLWRKGRAMSDCTHLKQGATFYLWLVVSNADDTLDVDGEAPQADTDLDVAMADAVEEVEEHRMTAYVYECRANRKIVRGKTRVIELLVKP